MSRKITVMFIPEKGSKRFSFTLSYFNMRFFLSSVLLLALLAGYFCLDYSNLSFQRDQFLLSQKENRILKSEAQLLSQNLDSLKSSLQHVHDFARKIGEMVNVKMEFVHNKTGIGPLSNEEFESAKLQEKNQDNASPLFPLGVNLDKLKFKSIFSKVGEIEHESNSQAAELQKLLSLLTHKKTLLYSIPTIMPVKGWITSGFGKRASPITGESSDHRGTDIAADIGTPIVATADGVVVFVGNKQRYGNIVVIAHPENGIVTRYAHNAENLVTVGQRVSRGEKIATVGMTGNTTGPHVHYEVSVNGIEVNPEDFFLSPDSMLF